MGEVNATDIKNQFGEFLDLTRDEAIGIRKSGKLTAVMMSADEYATFSGWKMRTGWRGPKRLKTGGSGSGMKKRCGFWLSG